MQDRKLNIDYGLIQGGYWLLAAVFFAFITPILQERQFDNTQIGILLGIRSVAAIFSQSLVSILADRYAKKIPLKKITAVVVFTAAFANLIFLLFPMDFLPTVILFFVVGAATYCISPMIDAVAMEFMKLGRKLNYTLCRSAGSASWALACVGIGWMMSKWGADSLLVLHIVFLVVLGVLLLRIETAKRPETKESSSSTQPSGIWQLLRSYPGYTWFLIAYTLLYMSSTLCTNFQIDVITSLGGDHTSLGYSEFLMAIAEVPVVFFYGKLKKRIGLNRVLFLIFLFGTAKVFCQSFAPNLPCFMLAQLWQMVSWGMSYTAVVDYVMREVPTKDLVKGQGLLTVAGAGIGNSLASYISGILYDHFSLTVLLGAGTVAGLVSVLLLMVALQSSTAGNANIYNTKEKEIEL